MSHIQLPYRYVKKKKQIQFNLPRSYEGAEYIKRLPFITNKNPAFGNEVLNVLRNREDF